jgi:uncharacterized protein YegL
MMNFSSALKRFVDRARLPVMMRALLQRELDAVQLDRWFETVAKQQYTRKLRFSTLFELMTQMVLCQSGSIRAAWLVGYPPAAPKSRPSCWQPRHLEITRP